MLKKILVSGLYILCTGNVFAMYDPYAPAIPQVWTSVITLSGGVGWANPGLRDTLYPFIPPIPSFYSSNSKSGTLGNGELYFGLQNFMGASTFVGQLGLGVAAAGNAHVSGEVNVFGVPDVYAFNYSANHVRVELKGKVIAYGVQLVQPYISSSIGVGFNHSYNYSASTIDPILYPTYLFRSNTTTALSWSVGAGIQRMLNPNWQVGVGYEFVDWGKAYLTGNPAISLNNGPELPHLYTNNVLFSLSYLF